MKVGNLIQYDYDNWSGHVPWPGIGLIVNRVAEIERGNEECVVMIFDVVIGERIVQGKMEYFEQHYKVISI